MQPEPCIADQYLKMSLQEIGGTSEVALDQGDTL